MPVFGIAQGIADVAQITPVGHLGQIAASLGRVSAVVFRLPTPIDEAVGFVDALLAVSGVQLAPLGPEWLRLRQLCLDKQLSGNDLPDAWLAAATLHLGEHLVSFDRGLRKLVGRSQFTLLEPAVV